jgi:peptidoglycan/LPS O-acetylase OafA/YrhL
MTRNQNLDALRGLAILMVLGHHLAYFPLWTRAGWAGVDLFFVLSGFLISGLLFREWQESGAIDFRRFFVRRGMKIYPAFYALLILTVAASLAYPGIPSNPVTWRSLLAELTFTQNYFQGIWGQTWSLAVEEHFYILLPVTLWLMYRRRHTTDPFVRLPLLFMIVATAEVALRVLNAQTHPARDAYLCPTHLRIDALLFGVLLGYYRHFQPEKFREMARSRSGFLIMGAAVFLLLSIPRNNPAMYTVGFSVVFFGFGILLVRTIDRRPHKIINLMVVRPAAKIGYYSYSIYLWHGWICRLLPHQTVPAFLGCLAACILVGIVMARVIEYPVLALRDRLFPSHACGNFQNEPIAVAATI